MSHMPKTMRAGYLALLVTFAAARTITRNLENRQSGDISAPPSTTSPNPAFSQRSIAIVSVLGFVLLVSLIVSVIYVRRTFWQRQQSAINSTLAKGAPIDIRHRKQTHSDRKVFSWFCKLDGESRNIDDMVVLLHSERGPPSFEGDEEDVLTVPSPTLSRHSVMSRVSGLSGETCAPGR